MTRAIIKICGLTEPDNIRQVLELHPDWIGLIFYPPSPRSVRNPARLDFLNDIDHPVQTMGVFVNSTHDEIMKVAGAVYLEGIQLHGHETPGLCRKLRNQGFIVVKSFGVNPGFDFMTTLPYDGVADYFLFDTGSPQYGGSGEQFDWNLLDNYHGDTPFLLSGGISPETNMFPGHPKFAGVDLNSRFEISPGIKDTGLLQKFIKQFRDE